MFGRELKSFYSSGVRAPVRTGDIVKKLHDLTATYIVIGASKGRPPANNPGNRMIRVWKLPQQRNTMPPVRPFEKDANDIAALSTLVLLFSCDRPRTWERYTQWAFDALDSKAVSSDTENEDEDGEVSSGVEIDPELAYLISCFKALSPSLQESFAAYIRQRIVRTSVALHGTITPQAPLPPLVKLDTPDPTLDDQIKALRPHVSETVFAQVQVLVSELGDAFCAGASVCESEDKGASLQWSALGIYCEIFDKFEGLETFHIDAFAPSEDRVEYKARTSKVAEAVDHIRLCLKARTGQI